MCLLFVYINPAAKEGEYKLVLVNNRDEFYSRATRPAHFWDSRILGGMDKEKGKEGGTWLAMKEDGKIGCLLNVFTPPNDFSKDAAGRGFLVVDYLLQEESGPEYMDKIRKSKVKYNPFNLVTIDPCDTTYDLTFYNSVENAWQRCEPGCHGFGNSPVDKPFNKIVKGKDKLKKLIETYGNTDKEEQLIAELNAMMQDSEENFPDDQLSKQGQGHKIDFLKGLSSLWVTCSSVGYGTRTTTIILVDHSDRVVFRERTMKEPIDLANVDWEKSHYSFKQKAKE